MVDGDAEGTQFGRDSADAVPAPGRGECFFDFPDQIGVLRVEIVPFGLVEIGGFGQPGDGEQVAQFGFREFLLDLEDGFVFLPWLRSSGSAKALNFFK